MGIGSALLDHPRDHVHAKIVVGLRVGEILFQQLIEVVGVEDVDPMEASAVSGCPAWRGGSARLSTKALILRLSSTAITPKALASWRGTSMQATVTRLQVDVIEQHGGVIHLVDVIPRQHHIFGAVL